MHKTALDIAGLKGQRRISAVACYDYTTAALCDRAGIDVLLVGDSAGMVMLGYENTIPVTMEQMCLFTGAVARARDSALVVADLPFMSYQAGVEEAISNSGALVRAGADAVKLEGGSVMSETITAITEVGIPVMGHIGLQPQTTALSEGYRVQGRTAAAAMDLIEDAEALEEAGAFAIVLEMTSREVAEAAAEAVGVPVIGIGSGAGCDGQVLVLQDLLGMYDRLRPRFAKRYMDLADGIVGALGQYKADVESGAFPADENSFPMDGAELKKLRGSLGGR